MISKLIVKGSSHEEAISRLKQALVIEGIKTNLSMLQKIMSHKQFKEGNTTTKFVNNH